MKRLAALVAGLLTTVALLTACSSDDSSTDPGSSSAEPVTVTHQFGTTTIPSIPQRVVSLNPQWTDSLVKLDVPITAEFVQTGYSGVDNRFAWTPEHSSEVVEYAPGDYPSVGDLARFDPDLILVGYVPDRQIYDEYARIAPTIPVMETGAVLDTWQDVTATTGEIFGKQDQAQQAIDDVEGQIDAVKQQNPAVVGKTFAFGQLTADRQLGAVTSDSDPATKLLTSLGLRIEPGLTALTSDTGGGRILISAERTNLLQSDVLLMWPLAGGQQAVQSLPGWGELPAVRRSSVLYLDNNTAPAFGTPSVFSVPYAIDLITPALQKVPA